MPTTARNAQVKRYYRKGADHITLVVFFSDIYSKLPYKIQKISLISSDPVEYGIITLANHLSHNAALNDFWRWCEVYTSQGYKEHRVEV